MQQQLLGGDNHVRCNALKLCSIPTDAVAKETVTVKLILLQCSSNMN